MNEDELVDISRKVNVLISLSIKQLLGEKSFHLRATRRRGVSDIVHYLADMRLDARDIAGIVGSPVTSVRTLLTPARRR